MVKPFLYGDTGESIYNITKVRVIQEFTHDFKNLSRKKDNENK
jgi:hypothetical protein